MNANHFIYRLIPPRPTFTSDMSDGERAAMGEHAASWTTLFERGRVVVFGAVVEPAGVCGLAVVEADSEDEVRAIAAADSATQIGLSPGVAAEWRP
ncbi:MAG TPA: YciI family protein [Acidimicrobiales bacterium]|nr:YciI family protein [Acidimicrobiales bacterium]